MSGGRRLDPDGGLAWTLPVDDTPLALVPASVALPTLNDLLIVTTDQNLAVVHKDHLDLAWT